MRMSKDRALVATYVAVSTETRGGGGKEIQIESRFLSQEFMALCLSHVNADRNPQSIP